MNSCQVNKSGTVLEKNGYDIMVVAAISGFTANGLNIPASTTNQLYLSNCPLQVTGDITNAAAGTVFYFYEGDLAVQ